MTAPAKFITGLSGARTGLILLFCTLLVMLVTWFVPALSMASLNMLYRLRGAYDPPADIVIVAIDDRSLIELGQWPWPRSVMARAVDRIGRANPLAIGLDVIYAEPSRPDEDRQLAEALSRSGRVVLPAQLYETAAGSASWLRPAPVFGQAAAATGHIHVAPEIDGMVQGIQLSKADDKGDRIWAFGLQIIRVAEGTGSDDFEELPGILRAGRHRIPVRDEERPQILPGVTFIRPNEMLINFAGPAGTFRYYSLVDLFKDGIAASAFEGKIVLIGATAPSMGDTRVAPFMHYGSARAEGGRELPGVEVHANIIHTIRGGLSVRPLSDPASFVLALLVMLASALAINSLAGWRQISVLGAILLFIIAGSYIAFSRFYLVPPLPSMLTGFAVVIPLLLSRSLAASRELDLKLAALAASQEGFLADTAEAARNELAAGLRLDLPHSLAWKLRTVDSLTSGLLARLSFINRVLSSMGEGVIVTDLSGRIVFANRIAEQIFSAEENSLTGKSFAYLLTSRSLVDAGTLEEAMATTLDHKPGQLELDLASPDIRHFSLGLSALAADPETVGASNPPPGDVIGVVALISDVTKRVELDRMKTETLQLVSHELRTPLSSIHGLSDVLLKFPVPPDESREMLGTIHSEAVRLGETINRYLDLTRLESGSQTLNLSSVDLRDLLSDCARKLAIIASEKRIRFLEAIDPDLPPLTADPQLLTQAVGNLIGNAVKYSPPDTEVTIGARADARTLTITISDQGYGIPENARDRIFDKFFRLERDTGSGVVGTGLGLPLVKEIVERHGGRISFESIEGSGTTFVIHLPLER